MYGSWAFSDSNLVYLRDVQVFSRRSFRGYYRASFRAQRELSEHGIPSEAPIFEKLTHSVYPRFPLQVLAYQNLQFLFKMFRDDVFAGYNGKS